MQQTDAHRDVQNYYGSVLKGSKDLKTNACCTASVPPKYVLDVLPLIADEIVERFYGCGSPIPCALEGATVLDLGCGTGKDVYVLSKLVGPRGKVIGVDMTPAQLDVARAYQDEQAERFGYDQSNVEFKCGYIEDLAALGIEDESVDLVVSNCVINLSPFKDRVFSEIFRVLKPGGELYFSDIFASRRMPAHLQQDPTLRGECLGGALYPRDFEKILAHHGINDYAICETEPIDVHNLELQSKLGFMSFTSHTIRVIKDRELEPTRENYGQTVTYLGTIPEMPRYFDFDTELRFIKNKPLPVDGNTARMLQVSRYAPHFSFSEKTGHAGPFDARVAKDAQDARLGKSPVDLPYLEHALKCLDIEPFEDRVGEPTLLKPRPNPQTMQVNIVYACNLSCAHCYLECDPHREETMSRQTMEACLDAFEARGFTVMDITGGAPELHPDFAWFVEEAAKRAQKVIVRTNLVLLTTTRYAPLIDLFVKHKVRLVGSLPYPGNDVTNAQRGEGVFEKSIAAIKRLNERGYGIKDDLVLDLVYNVSGPYLPPPQHLLEGVYKDELSRGWGVSFSSLLAFNNFAMGRFAHDLLTYHMLDSYLELLAHSYNTMATTRIMCLDQVNVDYDGRLYDCECNHVFGLPIQVNGRAATVHDLIEGPLERTSIRTHPVCYSCTAGFGSSCGGSLL